VMLRASSSGCSEHIPLSIQFRLQHQSASRVLTLRHELRHEGYAHAVALLLHGYAVKLEPTDYNYLSRSKIGERSDERFGPSVTK
jgi:hypothetical protein